MRPWLIPLLLVFINIVSILHNFLAIITFTVYVRACDFQNCLSFDTTREIEDNGCF